MSHGIVGVSDGGGVMPLGPGTLPVGIGREYYEAVGEYLRVAGRMLDSGEECSRGLSGLVDGWCRIACPVLSGCCSGVRAELSAVGGVGERVEVARDGTSVVEGPSGCGVSFGGGVPTVDVGRGCGPQRCAREVGGSGDLRDGDGSRVDGLSEVSCGTELNAGICRGRWYESNRRKKEKKRLLKKDVPVWRRGAKPLVDGSGGCVSDESATGSVCTVDTRTGVEIAAAQTLAARRVAENERAVAEAKVAKKLAEHRLRALSDKDRTVVVERLAAARYERKINEARLGAQTSFSKSQDSLKSLGSMGSAGELYAKQAIKKSREDTAMRKYVEDQLQVALEYLPDEAKQRIAEMPEPEFEDEFDVFGDCPSDYNEDQRQAYYDDLNWRNANHGLTDSGPPPPQRIPTPEELRMIEEEIRALSAN